MRNLERIKGLLTMLFVIISITISCNTITAYSNPVPKSIWEAIGPPFSQKTYEAESELTELLVEKKNRIAYCRYIIDKIKENELSLDDEMRMAIIINRMISFVPDKENEEETTILKIIEKARKHPNFYGAILPVAPPYFLAAIEVFKEKSDIVAKAPSSEGGIAEYKIKDMFLIRLREATKQNFGPNYGEWENWWTEEGQFLSYDKERMKY